MAFSRFNHGVLAAAAILLAAIPFARAQAAEPLSRDDVETIIKQYLHEHPEVILESVDAYRQKQEKLSAEESSKNIEKHLGYLTAPDAPGTGNPKGDVTVVEFFDYNCGYCKRALPDLQALLKTDKNLRLVLRDMPILSPTSVTASQWALAANKQGKYFEYHVALMNHNGPKDDSVLEKLAKDVGLNVEQLKKDAVSQDIAKTIQEDMTVAEDIGIHGTPAFIVNGQLYPGYLGPDGLKGAIDTARKNAAGKKKD